jgi:uncharacterized surface anchored protein
MVSFLIAPVGYGLNHAPVPFETVQETGFDG